MSIFKSSDGQNIPKGILVKAARKAEAERQTPRRPLESGERQVPWMWIAVGGSVGWVIIVLAVAMLTMGQENANRPDPRAPLPQAFDGPIADARPPANNVRPVAVEDEPAAPAAAPQKLVRPQPAKVDDLPPAIDVLPEEPALVNAPAPRAGNPAPVPARAPARRPVDLNVFADCDAIGTNVLFVKDVPTAFKKAKEERKMVFMVHLSGNFEDPGFT
jgi:hypothetical protein